MIGKDEKLSCNDYNAQGWVDVRDLASTVFHMRESGIYNGSSVSQVIRILVSSSAELSKQKFNSTENALTYLTSMGFRISHFRERQGTKMIKNMALQSLNDDQPADPIIDRAAQIDNLLKED